MKILLVEDDLALSSSMQKLLKGQGWAVEITDNGIAAVSLARTFQPELVLLDISLKGDVNGWDTCRELRRCEELTPGTLICAVSGYGTPEDICRSTDAGMDHHFVKPLFLNTLKTFLHDHGL